MRRVRRPEQSVGLTPTVPKRARSRTVLLAQMEDATTGSILAGLSANLNSIPKPLGQNFTYD
jgi:hypothetical protein